MKKSFIEGLEKQKQNKKMSSKMIFLLYRKQISEALDAGFSLLDIYNYMVSEQIYPYTYSSFLRAIKNNDLLSNNNSGNENDSTSEKKILAAKNKEPLKFNPKADIDKLI